MEAARKDIVTKRTCAGRKRGKLDLLQLIASGQVAIPVNIKHKSPHPYGINGGLKQESM